MPPYRTRSTKDLMFIHTFDFQKKFSSTVYEIAFTVTQIEIIT